MFESPIAVFIVFLFAGIAIVVNLNKLCHFFDFFTGNAWSYKHQQKHWNRQAGAMLISLVVASIAFLVAVAVNAINNSQATSREEPPKRIFIQELEKNSTVFKTTHTKHTNATSITGIKRHKAHSSTAESTGSTHHHSPKPVNKP
jgi:hypothetical protein